MKIGNYEVDTLGDPHLGRKFVTGVPLHRRGEREAHQFDLFASKLMNTSSDIHVCMGDIFDKFIVSPSVVIAAAEAYIDAAVANPKTKYYLIRGNHDASRDTTLRSSFDLLAAILAGVPNITIVTETPVIANDMVFIPWHPFQNAKQMVEALPAGPFEAAFGHWDVDDFGGDNVIPAEELSKRTKLAITGHVHTPGERKMNDVRVIITGSMEPYAHGEDPDATIYKTLSLEEARKLTPEEAKNLCIRVRLEEDEKLDFEIDCLQLTIQRLKVEAELEEVDFDTFDLQDLFTKEFESHNVSSTLTANFWDRLKSSNAGMV